MNKTGYARPSNFLDKVGHRCFHVQEGLGETLARIRNTPAYPILSIVLQFF